MGGEKAAQPGSQCEAKEFAYGGAEPAGPEGPTLVLDTVWAVWHRRVLVHRLTSVRGQVFGLASQSLVVARRDARLRLHLDRHAVANYKINFEP